MTNTKEQTVVWKQYPDYPFIEANQYGEIRTVDHYVTRSDGRKQFFKGHILKQHMDKGGYMQIHTRVNGKQVNLQVHRIVATCFLPNPSNLPQVNHKDCDRTNNSVENLEWSTPQYNTDYREKYGVSAKEFTKVLRKSLFAVNLKTLEILQFPSQSEAARQLGVDVRSINSVLKGRYKQTGGYWFTEDKEEITEEKIQKIKDRAHFFGGVFAVNLKTEKISFFKSQHEAARQLGVDQRNIQNVLKGRHKTAGGCWFCYADSNAVEKTRAKFGNDIAYEVKKLINRNYD